MDDDTRLAAVADIAVTTAVNLQAGQELVVSAPLEAAALVQQVARRAYRLGSPAVTCVYEDPIAIRERLVEGSDEALDNPAPWLTDAVVRAMRAGAARLQLLGPYPDLLAGIPAERIVRAHAALSRLSQDEALLLWSGAINASAIPVATASWARQVFPDLDEQDAGAQLRETLFAALRVTTTDPRQAWTDHLRDLSVRRERLQACRFATLRLFDGRTDLTVGLPPDHQWVGGEAVSATGVRFLQSLPSEELYTALDGTTAHGRIVFSRPLAPGGTLVRNLSAEFQHGTMTALHADEGLGVLERLLVGEESRQLGEIGLAPVSSPLGRPGVLFWNPLLDRNAASHVAFGPAPASCYRQRPGGVVRRDGPATGMHIDAMFGHDGMQVDGVTAGGAVVPVMRDGQYVL